MQREEKSGYKAEIQSLGAGASHLAQEGGRHAAAEHQRKERKHDDIIDTYGDDFEEEIEEDIPEDNNNHLLDSNDNGN